MSAPLPPLYNECMASFRDAVGQLVNQNNQLAQLAVPLPKQCTASSKTRWRDEAKTLRARCENPPMPGQRVCRFHGGKTPNSIAMAEERLQLKAAVKALRSLGEKVQPWERIDPRDALLDVVQQAYTVKAVAEYLVKDLSESDLDGVGAMFTEMTEIGPMTIPDRGGAKAVMRIKLYNEALDRAARVAKIAMDVGIEERMVKLAEGQASEIVEIIRIATKDLPDDQKLLVIQRTADELKYRSARRLSPVDVAVAATQALPDLELPHLSGLDPSGAEANGNGEHAQSD